ncbi:hypothetical protein P4O66_013938 [Electrophorus voltai]|uniref:Uncharacterized protein n=1 Tax=Electrophorus voltai TaxID=2609070 RepID=A0AAD8YR41_9TELE|nr:hypothetical protein P4O66_013938 [Electrophorus voltai]
MTLKNKSSSLKIMKVDYSDSGLYYYGAFLRDHMEFYNESHLDIKGHDDIPITTQECGGDDIFFKLTLLLSGIIIFIMALVVLLLLRLKKKSKQAHGKLKNDSLYMLQ